MPWTLPMVRSHRHNPVKHHCTNDNPYMAKATMFSQRFAQRLNSLSDKVSTTPPRPQSHTHHKYHQGAQHAISTTHSSLSSPSYLNSNTLLSRRGEALIPSITHYKRHRWHGLFGSKASTHNNHTSSTIKSQ